MKGLQVLIVDDEPDLAELVSFEFELIGSHVSIAENGQNAFKLCKEKNFDVIISDIRMPNGDGIELLKNIRKLDYKKPSIFLMTGFADISLQEAYHFGASAIFGKPFNRKELIATVSTISSPLNIRWNAVSDDSNLFKIDKTYKKIDEASKQGMLSLGHGGFFIRIDKEWPMVSETVAFSIRFEEEKELPEITGHGLVRWVRTSSDRKENKPSGIGVEICGLTPKCLSKCIEYIEKSKCSSYIPQK